MESKHANRIVILQVALLVAFVLTVVELQRSFHRQREYQRTAVTLTSLLSEFTQTLSEKTEAVSQQPAVRSNLKLDLSHAVQAQMALSLDSPLVQSILIRNQDCSKTYAAGAGVNLPCDAQQVPWTIWKEDGTTKIAFAKAVAVAKKKWFFITATNLDSELIAKLNNGRIGKLADIKLETEWEAGGKLLPFLSKAPPLVWVPPQPGWISADIGNNAEKFQMFAFIVFAVLNLLLLVKTWRLNLKAHFDMHRSLRLLKKWAYRIGQNAAVPWSYRDLKLPKWITKELDKVADLTEASLSTHKRVKDELHQENLNLKMQNRELKKDIEILKNSLQNITPNMSVTLSLKEAGPELIEKTLSAIEMVNDGLSDQNASPPHQELASLVGHWQREIAARGARKFIKSSYETTSSHDSERSQLEDDLDQIYECSRRIAADHQKQQGILSGVRDDLENFQRLIGHWYSLALHEKDMDQTQTLAKCVDLAAQLLTAHLVASNPMKIINNASNNHCVQSVPTSVLVSAIFHILCATYGIAGKAKQATVLVNEKTHLDRKHIVVSLLPTDGPRYEDPRSLYQSHIQTAQNLLARYPAQCETLRTLDGIYSFSISWSIDLPLGPGVQSYGVADQPTATS